ncbi:hypothetical protein QIW57_03025 [Francisellaceae bacterium CB52]
MSNGLWYIKKDVVDDYVGNIKDYIPEEYKDIVLTFLHKYHNLLPSYADLSIRMTVNADSHLS